MIFLSRRIYFFEVLGTSWILLVSIVSAIAVLLFRNHVWVIVAGVTVSYTGLLTLMSLLVYGGDGYIDFKNLAFIPWSAFWKFNLFFKRNYEIRLVHIMYMHSSLLFYLI